MEDYRIQTFLTLCRLMNYRRTAETLSMTQPAVTQHIHYLEAAYGCKLFTYQNRILQKTEQCVALERHALSTLYNERTFLQRLRQPQTLSLSVGATKTIGDYMLEGKVLELLNREDVRLNLIIDNTEHLLERLNALELDVLMIEGYMDKNLYGHRPIKEEELVGICAPEHPFAHRTVTMEDLLPQHILIREEGSGTLAVLESFLKAHGYTTSSFSRCSRISSFKLIESAVAANCGISFVYESVFHSSRRLASFRVEGGPIRHEFNFVFLPGTNVEPCLELLC